MILEIINEARRSVFGAGAPRQSAFELRGFCKTRSAQLQALRQEVPSRSSILSGSSSWFWRTQVGNNPNLIFPFWGKQPHVAGRAGRRLAVDGAAVSLHRNPGDASSGLKGERRSTAPGDPRAQ